MKNEKIQLILTLTLQNFFNPIVLIKIFKIKDLFLIRKTLFIFTLCFLTESYAQHVVTTEPSPSALGEINLNESLVDKSTGAISYSIPIAEIREGALIIPVSLNYYSRGIKVEDIASWVGMGWSLNAGAVITRSVVGFPDDMNDTDEGVGILHSNALADIEALNFDDTEADLSEEVYDFYENKKDTQPDIFTLNLIGNQTTFIFNKNNEIEFLDNNNFHINYTQDTNGKIVRFDLIDENGVSYIFDQYETTNETTTYRTFNVNSGHTQSSADEKNIIFNSAWHLSSMTFNNNTILLEYYSEDIEFNKKKLEIGQICKNQDCNTYPTALGTSIPIKNSKIEVSSKKIRSIKSSNDEVLFAKLARSDINGGSRLASIRTQSFINLEGIDFFLNHDYMNSPNIDSNNPYIYKRLQLKSIYKENIKTHEFSYDPTTLPNRESAEQDFWGYYNGNGETTLIPKIYTYPESLAQKTSFYQQIGQGSEYIVNGANRFSNFNYAKAGILINVKEQLGNEINIEYELNDFKFNDYLFQGNGIRVKQIEITKPQNYSYSRNYTYDDNGDTSGIVDLLPSFAYYHEFRNIRYISNQKVYDETPDKKYILELRSAPGVPLPIPLITDLGASNWSDFERHYYSTLRFSLPLKSNISSDYSVYYTSTTESFLDKKVLYSFEVNDLQFEFPSNNELSETQIRRVRSEEDLHNGYGVDPEIIQSTTPNYFDVTYPFIPKLSKSWSILDLKEIKYLNNNELIKKEVYDSQIASQTSIYKSVMGLKFDFFERANYKYLSALQALSDVYRKSIICFSRYPYLVNTSKLPLTKTTYHYEGSESTVESEVEYTYNNIGLVREEKQLSGDKEYKTVYKYPQDLSSQPYMSNLITQNRLSEVIEQEQYVNDQLIGRTVTEYNLFDDVNLVQPYKTRTYNKNNELISTNIVSKYNDRGIPIEQYAEESNIYSSSITAYNNQLVIAKALNAAHNEIFHTSFEQFSDGGVTGKSYTGIKYKNGSYTIPFVKPNSKEYVVSYWEKLSGGEWSFSGYMVYSDNMVIGNTNSMIDEVRVHPRESQMTTTTYSKFCKKPITESDARGNIVRYEYDDLCRLETIKDSDDHILSKNQYHYKGQQ